MTRWSLSGLVLLAAVAPSERLTAQDPHGLGRFRAEDKMNFAGGADFLTAFYWRGILQDDQNILLQPWFNVTAGGIAGGDLISGVDAGIQNWNTFQLDSGQADSWFRSDLSLQLSLDLGDRLNVEASYNWYKSPNESFDTITEVAFDVGVQDESGLNPSAVLAIELDGQADGVAPSGVFLGLGIEPRTRAGSDIRLSFPIRVGLSLGDYYQDAAGEDSLFGYAEAGINARIPFALLPRSYGEWVLDVGVHVLYLGDAMAALNSDTDLDVFGFAGVTFTF